MCFTITLYWLYVRACLGEVWVPITSLTPPLFFEVPVLSQEGEQSCISVRSIDFDSFYILL